MNTLPKQIVENFIPYDPSNSEAFFYRFTNLKNSKKYPGIHKGKPYDGYMFSSSNEEFHKDFLEPDAQFKYEVLQYGTYEYLQAVEYNFLTSVNAKDNPEYYNKSNGIKSEISIPRVGLIEHIVNEIRETKAYEGVQTMFKLVKDLPPHRLQIREFTLDKDHVIRLRDIINHKSNLEHLLIVILKNRLYRGVLGDLVTDGNHSIEAAETSKYGASGSIPVLEIPEHIHKDWTDDEVDLLALMSNPREENPRLQSSYEDIARQICKLRVAGLDSNSKEVSDLKDYFKLTTKEKSKVSKIANEMFKEIVPQESTWINYGTGSEGRKMEKIIRDESVVNGWETGIFSKCYSTAKYNAWADLHDMMIHNKNHPDNPVKEYKVYFYHTSEDMKNKWERKWKSNNDYAIDELLKPHGIKRNWIYLKETRSKITMKGGE